MVSSCRHNVFDAGPGAPLGAPVGSCVVLDRSSLRPPNKADHHSRSVKDSARQAASCYCQSRADGEHKEPVASKSIGIKTHRSTRLQTWCRRDRHEPSPLMEALEYQPASRQRCECLSPEKGDEIEQNLLDPANRTRQSLACLLLTALRWPKATSSAEVNDDPIDADLEGEKRERPDREGDQEGGNLRPG